MIRRTPTAAATVSRNGGEPTLINVCPGTLLIPHALPQFAVEAPRVDTVEATRQVAAAVVMVASPRQWPGKHAGDTGCCATITTFRDKPSLLWASLLLLFCYCYAKDVNGRCVLAHGSSRGRRRKDCL